jgi:Trypsin-like peptidase domain
MNAIDQLIHITVRIETSGPDGIGSGTGFFLHLCENGEGHVPVIVTNKHVIKNAATGRFVMTQAKARDAFEPIHGQNVSIALDHFESRWLQHPDPDVDLAVMPIAPILEEAERRNTPVFFRAITSSLIATESDLKNLNAIEDILMIGYPSGLWDEKNNTPIVRKGITATPPANRFNDRPEFVIDCACFPGSSGSPILLFNASGYVDKQGNTMMGGSRVKLLGVLWGGPQYNAVGALHVVPIPTSNAESKKVALSQIPMNLGYCVRAEELRWFEEHFEEKIAERKVA